MKFVEPSPFNDPDAAARKLVEIANTIEPAQDGRSMRKTVRFRIGGEISLRCVNDATCGLPRRTLARESRHVVQ